MLVRLLFVRAQRKNGGTNGKPTPRAGEFFAETREHWPIMSVYERFEQIVAIVLSLVIAVVIAVALVQLVARIVPLLLSGAIISTGT